MKRFLPSKFEFIGWSLVGLAAACFIKAGQLEYAARHIWEDADRINKAAAKEDLCRKSHPSIPSGLSQQADITYRTRLLKS